LKVENGRGKKVEHLGWGASKGEEEKKHNARKKPKEPAAVLKVPNIGGDGSRGKKVRARLNELGVEQKKKLMGGWENEQKEMKKKKSRDDR